MFTTEQVTIYILGPLLSAFVLSLPFRWWLWLKTPSPITRSTSMFHSFKASYFLSWFLAKVKCFFHTVRAWNLLRELLRDCKSFFTKSQYTRTGFKRYAYTNKLTCCKNPKTAAGFKRLHYRLHTLSLSCNGYRHWYMLQSRLFCEITFFLSVFTQN